MDVLAANDRRLPHEKIERIRRLRPDMFLLSGGTDGGTVSHVVELAEFIAAADPRPRFGSGFRLPLIYAGNRDARAEIENTLAEKTALTVTENLRPVLERENLGPARQVIHDLFLEHVMAQAPGYRKLMTWTGAPIVPTPAAVGRIIQTIARLRGIDVIGVDIGGATTDVFSVFRPPSGGGADREEPVFNRSVSANLGMSYSISNVLNEAGLESAMRWIPFDIEETDLRDRIKNKMIRPTTIPQQLEELQLEHALAREALRLAFVQHRALAVGLKGVQSERTLSDVFEQSATGESLIDMTTLDLLVGSGGVLSHAPPPRAGRGDADRRLRAGGDHPPRRGQHFHDAPPRGAGGAGRTGRLRRLRARLPDRSGHLRRTCRKRQTGGGLLRLHPHRGRVRTGVGQPACR